jgi:putative ABC transport system ATP-binding protein
MSEPFLVTRGLHKSYPVAGQRLHVIRDLEIEVGRGEMVAIVGASGVGKSTLLHVLGGLDRPDAGDVRLGDVDLAHITDDALVAFRNRQVGFVFQFHHLLPEFTAVENVEMPLRIARMSQGEARPKAEALLARVGLAERLGHRPGMLSGGEQQRVAVARALASRPEVVFADEPTGNLDSRSGAEILMFLQRSVRDMGQTIVVVTHDPAAAAYADRVIFLADGQIVDEILEPTADAVLDRMKHFDVPAQRGN